MTKDCRAQHVIELAGGVTEEADMDRVNLAQLCKDGGHIKVPRFSKTRLKQKMQARKLPSGAGISGEISGTAQYEVKKKTEERKEISYSSRDAEKLYPDTPYTGERGGDMGGTNEADTLPVHLNTATETELAQLPGVGNATARRIISFRKQHRFQRIEDIMQVPGIGPAKFAKMKNCLAL